MSAGVRIFPASPRIAPIIAPTLRGHVSTGGSSAAASAPRLRHQPGLTRSTRGCTNAGRRR
jgi:hypothetical protein